MQMRAANDDAPAASVVAQSGTQGAIAGIVMALPVERKLGRTERNSGPKRDLCRYNDDLDYDNLLGIVGVEMAQPLA